MSSRHVVDLRGGKPVARRSQARAPHAASVRRERRASPLRVRRRKARLIVLAIALLVIAGAVYGVHLASYLPQFTVSSITVSGAEKLEPSLVEAFVAAQLDDGSYHFISRSNIFVYPQEVIERALESSFPHIKTASVGLSTPLSRRLAVTIEERQPFAQWCAAEGSCYAMDNTGFVFASASSSVPTDYATPYIFTGDIADAPVGKTFIPGHMPGVLTLLRILQQQGAYAPAGMTVESDQDISVHFAEGFALKVSFGEDADTLARNLKLVLASPALEGKLDELEYVDLRFGNRVYYKLKGESATSSSR